MSNNLQLSLKTKWYEMTDPDKKREDYRSINEYWFKRLVYDYKKVFKYLTGIDWDSLIFRDEIINRICSETGNMIGFKPFKTNIMTLGYPNASDESRIKRFEHAGIEIRAGREEWGAEKGKLYFVIKHGKRL